MTRVPDDAQTRAIAASGKATLVVGGPGTGKTEVIAWRTVRAVRDGAAPEQIKVVVPHGLAARRMRERIEELLGEPCAALWVGTIEALGATLLRRHADLWGRTARFSIHDVVDVVQFIGEYWRPEDGHGANDPPEMAAQIWRLKAELMTPDRFELMPDASRDLVEVYRQHEKELARCNAFDRRDLVGKSVEMLQGDSELCAAETNRLGLCLVDDFHDLTPAEHTLLRMLSSRGSLFACGDDDQSVFGAEGTDPTPVLEFEEQFEGSEVFELDRCYRASGNLVRASNEIAAKNTLRRSKVRTPVKPDGPLVRVLESWDERGESVDIERRVRALQAAGAGLSEIVILCREPWQFRSILEVLKKLVIPHRVIGATRFFEGKEIKDLVAYLRLVSNPGDLLSLRRVINVPRRGIGKLTLDRVRTHAAEQGQDLFGALRDAECIEDLPKNSKTKILKFCSLIDDLIARIDELDAAEILDRIIEGTAYIEDIHQQNVADRDTREAVVRELQATARRFCARYPSARVQDFLGELCLLEDADRYDVEEECLYLMTIPAARGLGFPHGVLAGLEAGLLPGSFPTTASDPEDPRREIEVEVDEAEVLRHLEAERRLFHVAFSRFGESLTVCHARNRKRKGGKFCGEPSRFLAEIPDGLVERVQTFERETEIFDTLDQAEVPPPGAGEWVRFEIEDRVNHAEWGVGKILETEGLGQDLKLTILFEGNILKKVLLRYAKLERVS